MAFLKLETLEVAINTVRLQHAYMKVQIIFIVLTLPSKVVTKFLMCVY